MNIATEETNARFANRRTAGVALAGALRKIVQPYKAKVLGLPRGGVPVAYEISMSLHIPLDVMLVRKLGIPGHEEVAMGAIATGGVRYLDWHLIAARKINSETIADVVAKERLELERREQLYRGAKAPLNLQDQQVILVDDGLATGATMRVAIEASRRLGAAQIVIAVPVAPLHTLEELAELADEVVCPLRPENFYAVSLWYQTFPQTSDREVQELLARAWSEESLFET